MISGLSRRFGAKCPLPAGERELAQSKRRSAWLVLPLLLIPTPALAHRGHDGLSGFIAGLLHPLTGLDHLMTMLMVGLGAGIAFPRHWWLCPAAFIAFMLGGFAYGAGGGSLPIAEVLILASLVGLGLALLAQTRPPLALSAGIVALFAIGHGFAHGSEMTGSNSIAFAGGFLLSTAALHAIGLAAAYSVQGRKQQRVGQAAGLAATITAAVMAWPV